MKYVGGNSGLQEKTLPHLLNTRDGVEQWQNTDLRQCKLSYIT